MQPWRTWCGELLHCAPAGKALVAFSEAAAVEIRPGARQTGIHGLVALGAAGHVQEGVVAGLAADARSGPPEHLRRVEIGFRIVKVGVGFHGRALRFGMKEPRKKLARACAAPR